MVHLFNVIVQFSLLLDIDLIFFFPAARIDLLFQDKLKSSVNGLMIMLPELFNMTAKTLSCPGAEWFLISFSTLLTSLSLMSLSYHSRYWSRLTLWCCQMSDTSLVTSSNQLSSKSALSECCSTGWTNINLSVNLNIFSCIILGILLGYEC